MEKQFLKTLTNFKDYEFITLEHHLAMARMVRDIMSKNTIDSNVMAEKIGIPVKRIKEVINGSYPFDLCIISKIQAFNQELRIVRTKKESEMQDIQFSNYKYQYPAYVERVNKLVKMLEKDNEI